MCLGNGLWSVRIGKRWKDMTSLKHEQLLCSWLPLESYVGNILYIISWFNARKEPAVQMHLSGVGSWPDCGDRDRGP